MPRPTRVAVLGVAALALVLSGCSGTPRVLPDLAVGDRPVPAAPPAAPAASPAAPAVSPSASPPASPSAGPSQVPSEPAPGPAAAPDLAAVQRALAGLRYYAGPVDGQAGPALRSAVMAFQKVQGIGVDGAVGPQTLAALAAPRTPSLRSSSPADRVEVDLTRQVLYVVEDGRIERILPVSSGNGARYAQQDGSTVRALTPVGHYRIERRIVGERHAPLGTLYDPQYFYRGWAIHGSDSVPAVPASHGCVRVTRADARYLLDAVDVGTAVHLYGGTHVFSPRTAA